MAATAQSYIKLARSLPPQILRFLTRYQPRIVTSTTASTPSFTSSTSTVNQSTNIHQAAAQHTLEPSDLPNPFRSQKNPETGLWRDPIYSLRRQADLVKMARANGVEELLPPTSKGTAARIQKRAEHGLRVKGTGVGQRVKGKEWERTMKGKLERRRVAMEGMSKMIQDWKQRGHGRGWKKFPR